MITVVESITTPAKKQMSAVLLSRTNTCLQHLRPHNEKYRVLVQAYCRRSTGTALRISIHVNNKGSGVGEGYSQLIRALQPIPPTHGIITLSLLQHPYEYTVLTVVILSGTCSRAEYLSEMRRPLNRNAAITHRFLDQDNSRMELSMIMTFLRIAMAAVIAAQQEQQGQNAVLACRLCSPARRNISTVASEYTTQNIQHETIERGMERLLLLRRFPSLGGAILGTREKRRKKRFELQRLQQGEKPGRRGACRSYHPAAQVEPCCPKRKEEWHTGEKHDHSENVLCAV